MLYLTSMLTSDETRPELNVEVYAGWFPPRYRAPAQISVDMATGRYVSTCSPILLLIICNVELDA